MISREVSSSHGLFLSNSLPIREMDMVGVPFAESVPIAANRGASGIDGIVASAAGFARGLNLPVVLIVGDQALLHDLNSLYLLRVGPPVTVVVFNNDGGGIFSMLPIADHQSVFERFFGAPHGLGFEMAAAMFGLDYLNPTSPEQFVSGFRERLRAPRAGIIEIKTTRAENATTMKRLQEMASRLSA